MSKPRIIAGSAKGRVLEVPKHGTRPSPAILRQALFNILEFRKRGVFLDLFSGSGAIGLEAASRGWQAICVELNRKAAQVIKRNAEKLKLNVKLMQGDALTYVKTAPKVDIAFAAPPYPLDLQVIFRIILESNVVSAGGLYIFQHPKELEVSLSAEKRVYGSNALSFIEVASNQ
jgi:16S rRNA (guanine(966)-N(2))-methyltransferase RsmD